MNAFSLPLLNFPYITFLYLNNSLNCHNKCHHHHLNVVLFSLVSKAGGRGLSGAPAVTSPVSMADKLDHVTVYLATRTAWVNAWRAELAP